MYFLSKKIKFIIFRFTDVIDWIHDNLIDSSRTRRAIIIKLKELGLIFKAPTKKKNALPANVWRFDDDQRLRDLYDELRLHDGTNTISIR